MDPATRPCLLTTVHGLYSPGFYSSIMTRGERVIAISRTVERYIHRHFPNCPHERIHVIPRGVAPEAFPRGLKPTGAWWDAWHAQYPATRGKRLLALPGRITRLKGHADFIRLLARLRSHRPEVHGLIVGPQDPRRLAYARELRELAASLGLTELTFTGQRSDMPQVLAACDIVFALSADPPEAFGRTALEALALGRPVIGYDAGGTAEVLGDLLPQGLVKPGDLSALGERTLAFLDAPPTPASNERYTLRRMLDEELALCEELASHRGR
jgi:glycosyltransferase involved in cell wall biosynthesis